MGKLTLIVAIACLLVMVSCSVEPEQVEVTRIVTEVAEVEVTRIVTEVAEVEVTRLVEVEVEVTRLVELATPTPEPPSRAFPFSNTLPIRWEGWFVARPDPEMEFFIQIDTLSTAGSFRGTLNVPDNDYLVAITGRIVEEFSESEQEKWEFVEGFGTEIGGTWITFHGVGDSPGRISYAHVDDEGVMRGVQINDTGGSSIPPPTLHFELSLTDQ